jgi:hypothetical protein
MCISIKYLAYLNILFGDNHVQNSGNCKKGGCPEDHFGIKNRNKKIPVTSSIIRIEKLFVIGN